MMGGPNFFYEFQRGGQNFWINFKGGAKTFHVNQNEHLEAVNPQIFRASRVQQFLSANHQPDRQT